jgi:hypothetical protein
MLITIQGFALTFGLKEGTPEFAGAEKGFKDLYLLAYEKI